MAKNAGRRAGRCARPTRAAVAWNSGEDREHHECSGSLNGWVMRYRDSIARGQKPYTESMPVASCATMVGIDMRGLLPPPDLEAHAEESAL